jgi:hypothetical protein
MHITHLQVENHLNSSIEFELYAKKCSSTHTTKYPVRSYDTYGASPWETIPDILHMYGMCSYRDWFEYLEFVDPTDKVNRVNAGACNADVRSRTGCDPASFNAFQSLWWDTRRPFAETGMLTLSETMKFQVHPHPCDRDYQHADGLVGCSPEEGTLQSRGAIGLVHMRSQARTIPSSKDGEYGTYAQTLRKDGFINMLGRPPFNYTDGSPMRKAGFMSASTLTKGPNQDSIFKQCNSLEQCFKDQFTHHGKETTRRVFVPLDALGISVQSSSVGDSAQYSARDWQPSDATRCGIAGVLVMDANGNSVNRKCQNAPKETHYCCMVDMQVAPLFYLFSKHGAEVMDDLDRVCNRGTLSQTIGIEIPSSAQSFQVFSRSRVQSIVSTIKDGYYSIPVQTGTTVEISVIMRLLNELLNEFSPPPAGITTPLNYVQIVDCSAALYEKLQTHAVCPPAKTAPLLPKVDSGPFCADYHLAEGQGSNKMSSMYYFLQVSALMFCAHNAAM